ncbi:putative quinol monooxygenase [Rhodococcus sp. MSC1_016]|uniref:putative quinol monooxygenase n=1 Tax=Rhodococcus sp. MSC1_016 TaxID=2909266 RepID=UPI00202F7681|nr:putative quinol monooxygenase [Rhodococcus sp. MSC1_016]
MIAVIAEVYVKDGAAGEFEAVVETLASRMREAEPGNLMYRLTRSRSENRQYKFIELYADSAALRAHGDSQHFRQSLESMVGLLDGEPHIEYLDAVHFGQ